MTTTVGTENPQNDVSDMKPRKKRDAIIVIPGLLHEPGRALRASSEKIAAALDRQAKTGKATFLLKEGKEEQYQDNTTPATTIIRKDETDETPLIDMYEMSYEHTLTGQFKGRNPLLQVISVSYSLVRITPRFIIALGKRSKTATEKVRILNAALILALLVAYIVLLLVTAVGSAADLGAKLVADTSIPYEEVLRSLQGAFVVTTALGLLSRTTIKQLISRSSVWFASAISYINMDDRRSALTGQVSSLLEHISEKKEAPYRNVHMITYCFGSIIAIDALFPDDEAPSRRNLDIDTFVTIGSPFDFIRTFWGRYFANRYMLEGAPRKWLNIYMSADVLSSDFKNQARVLRRIIQITQGSKTDGSDPQLKADHTDKEARVGSGENSSGHRTEEHGTIGIMKSPEENLALSDRLLAYKEHAGIEVTEISAKDSQERSPGKLVYPQDENNIEFGTNIDPGPIERYLMLGFKLHARYWGAEEPYARSCFDIIVQSIYDHEDEPALK